MPEDLNAQIEFEKLQTKHSELLKHYSECQNICTEEIKEQCPKKAVCDKTCARHPESILKNIDKGIKETGTLIFNTTKFQIDIKNKKGDLAKEIIENKDNSTCIQKLNDFNKTLDLIPKFLVDCQILIKDFKLLNFECLMPIYKSQAIEEQEKLLNTIKSYSDSVFMTLSKKQSLLSDFQVRYGHTILKLLVGEIIVIFALLVAYFILFVYDVKIPENGTILISSVAIAVFTQSIAMVIVILNHVFAEKGLVDGFKEIFSKFSFFEKEKSTKI